jgi:uncharacterized protein (DUF2147 family)
MRISIRRLFISLLTSLLFAGSTRADQGGEIYGLWATPKNHGRVRVEPCGPSVCGRILDGDQIRANPAQADALNPDPALRERSVKGLLILEGYRGGPTQWSGGRVYDPQTGDSSSDSTVELVAPGTLKVRGCRWLLCRTEIWTKISQDN